jgi:uncharacterized protein (TIGR02147 family)
MTPTLDYRELLKRELENRLRRNSGYSLRAYARDLGLQPARLSSILSGKKGLSRTSASAIAQRLGLSERETTLFVAEVESRHSRSKSAKRLASTRLKEIIEKHPARSLSLDAFQLISDWHHLAIVELLKWNDAVHEAKWIAKRLGISPIQAKEALARLLRLGLIRAVKEAKGTRYEPVLETVLSPDGTPSDAVKKFHEQILRKAIDALYLQPVGERDFCAQISSIRASDLPAIRRETRDFFDRIEAKFANAPDGDRIVCISNQIFNLTVPNEGVPHE